MSKLLSNFKLGVILLCFFVSVSAPFPNALGQSIQVTGKVTDAENGESIPGVSISQKGTTKGTITDLDGNYSLEVSEDATLVFSFIGYATQEIPLNGQSTVNVSMETDITGLEEVVVVGYGTQKKQDLTGAVSVVKMEEMTQQPSPQLTSQLQGRVSGVTITGSGQPGQAPEIKIRGVNTFGNNTPLFIVDGVPTPNINDINPNDVETMQVLKDAGAASIYGSRAANGVIIVTTKKGRGDVKVNYNMYIGSQQVQGGNPWDILSSQEMADLKFMALRNTNPGGTINDDQYGSGPDPVLPNYIAPVGAQTVDESLYNVNPYYTDPQALDNFYRIVEANKTGTNWFQEIFAPARIQSHNLSVNGGSDKGSYFFSMSYFDQQGTLTNTYLKRYTIRSNTSYNVTDNIRIGENLTYSISENPTIDNLTEGSAIGMAFRQQPIIPVYDIMGNFAGSFGSGLGNAKNPVAIQERTKNNRGVASRLFGNVFAEVDFLEHFTARTSFGGQYYSNTYNRFQFPEYENSENLNVNQYTEGANFNFNYTWTNTLTYKREFNERHDLTVLLGTEAYRNNGRDMEAFTQGYFSFDPDYVTLTNGSGTQQHSSSVYKDALFSLFGRVDYTYNDKYILSATVRRDGSSRFLNEQYGVFPAVSAGWRISEEEFMPENSWVDDLKLRGGYGQMGNQLNVAPGNAYSTYEGNRNASYYPIDGSNSTIQEGFQEQRIGNPDAKWERNINSNIGIDASFWQGKVQLTLDYYNKTVDDLLYNPEVIGTQGAAEPPYINIAKMTNKGFDMDASTYFNLATDLTFTTTLSFTTYSNEIVKIADGVPYFDQEGRRFNGSNIIRNQVGHPVSEFYGYQVIGFWNSEQEISDANASAAEATGDSEAIYQDGIGLGRFKYQDTDGDGIITPDDRTPLGNPNPKFTYGINLGLEYRNWDFSMFLYGVSGNDIWNNVKWWTDFYSSFQGAKSHTALYDSWTPENMNATAPIQETTGSFSTAGVPNSYFVENGSYLRARQTQIGYTFDQAFLDRYRIGGLRLYAQAANLFTITNYSGLDPEISGGTTSFGIDEGQYPNQRQFIFGLNLTF
ncbi:SusC/RagA family TonB-linked outer membrane protein [Echinicola rosea]|uniref:SusC/RagA family TonB-linked outer membrane protein n=1 Tax=Echinicola rosea TaxID=1807691 RepID=A0ABQ1VA87_9BACT|nr:TonB-dependent receptor [Echinicola rosea]GGF46369.1 SusC/RagA family TonB-linked outer membrane protein [Echinicola rosea]